MKKRTPIASSSTVEGLQKLLNEYYYSAQYVINPETLAITNIVLGNEKVANMGIFAVEKKGRFTVYQIQ